MKSLLSVALLLSVFVFAPKDVIANDAVSAFQVIANPSAFDGKELMVEGILGFIGEDTVALFVDHGSRDSQITINAFLITTMLGDRKIGKFGRDDLKKMDGKYVAVWGQYVFSTPRNESFTGALGKITGIGVVPKFPEFSSPAEK